MMDAKPETEIPPSRKRSTMTASQPMPKMKVNKPIHDAMRSGKSEKVTKMLTVCAMSILSV